MRIEVCFKQNFAIVFFGLCDEGDKDYNFLIEMGGSKVESITPGWTSCNNLEKIKINVRKNSKVIIQRRNRKGEIEKNVLDINKIWPSNQKPIHYKEFFI